MGEPFRPRFFPKGTFSPIELQDTMKADDAEISEG